MRHFSLRSIVLLAGVVLLLAGVGTFVWVERMPLLAWYYVRGLSQASEADQGVWAERLIALDNPGVEALLDCLRRDDPQTCTRAATTLTVLGQRLARQEGRWPDLAARLADAFGRASPAGQQAALQVLTAWLERGENQPEPPLEIAESAGRILTKAAHSNSDVHARALHLTQMLLDMGCPAKQLGDCRELVHACLKDAAAGNRAWAVRLAVHPGLGLMEQVVPLLHDPVAEVRREVMLAARLAPETVVKTDELLHWLHDSDEDVRRLCEGVLSQRGMTKKQVNLGRMLTDSDALVRLQVIEAIDSADDLEPGIWLRLLTVDPAPLVRGAAISFASSHPLVDLSDRLDQMARSDPSESVRQIAQIYSRMPQPQKDSPNRP